jgi:hypothetical protein
MMPCELDKLHVSIHHRIESYERGKWENGNISFISTFVLKRKKSVCLLDWVLRLTDTAQAHSDVPALLVSTIWVWKIQIVLFLIRHLSPVACNQNTSNINREKNGIPWRKFNTTKLKMLQAQFDLTSSWTVVVIASYVALSWAEFNC